jgi:hypothetical protein
VRCELTDHVQRLGRGAPFLSPASARPAEAEPQWFGHVLALQDQSYAALHNNQYADN